MRYAGMLSADVGNGPDVCATLFVQGCSHHCKGCFNPETWDFNGGEIWNRRTEYQFIEACKKEYVKNICILGGEPLDQGDSLIKLLKGLKKEVNKPIWLWTGYILEDILFSRMPHPPEHTEMEFLIWNQRKEIASLCDVIVDGPFIEELKKPLKHRGSSNQRIVDIKKTLETGAIALYQK